VRPKNVEPKKHPKKCRQRSVVASKRLNIIGTQVRKIRIGLRPQVSQEDLAGRLAREGFHNLTRVIVNKIESGKRTVIDGEARALARALRVPLQRLFEEE
jgi:ribosome-binding protein aMBF1 (putative translation factor)